MPFFKYVSLCVDDFTTTMCRTSTITIMMIVCDSISYMKSRRKSEAYTRVSGLILTRTVSQHVPARVLSVV